MSESMQAPPVETVVETALYADDLEAAEAFYGKVLGLELIGKTPNWHVFFRVGPSTVLLLFRADVSLPGSDFPSHGAKGAGHFALGIRTENLDAWRKHLQASGVSIEQERTWPRGGVSIYFRDPADNLCELITPGVWGIPSGW